MSIELFGAADDYPRPAWEVLDAARGSGFTGELLFDLDPPVSVYLDRGEVYLAERANDTSLGDRLVDAGALNAEQLEHGSIAVGDTPHLGRLFDRVPSVDRDVVLVMTEWMNDECVVWLAPRVVDAVIATPYRHHPSGVHRWSRAAAADDLEPGDPLPAPPPTAAPLIAVTPPGGEHDSDSIVSWGATEAPPPSPFAPPAPDTPADPPAGTPEGDQVTATPSSVLDSDWADRLETHGLPDADSDPLAVPRPLPPRASGPTDRFELIWPSGEIDEHFDAGASLEHAPEHDHDRAGPTARVVRRSDVGEPGEPGEPEDDAVELWDFETTGPSFGPADDDAGAAPAAPTTPEGDRDLNAITDETVLSMRRAVEPTGDEATGSLRRALDSATVEAIRDGDLVLPGRVATRTESSLWSLHGVDHSTNRSVFDETVPAPAVGPASTVTTLDPAPVTPLVPVPASGPVADGEPGRVSALRRLIGGLRRH